MHTTHHRQHKTQMPRKHSTHYIAYHTSKTPMTHNKQQHNTQHTLHIITTTYYRNRHARHTQYDTHNAQRNTKHTIWHTTHTTTSHTKTKSSNLHITLTPVSRMDLRFPLPSSLCTTFPLYQIWSHTCTSTLVTLGI